MFGAHASKRVLSQSRSSYGSVMFNVPRCCAISLLLLLLVCVGIPSIVAREAIADRDRIEAVVHSEKAESCALHLNTDVAKQRSPLLLYPGTLQLVRTIPNSNGTIDLGASAAIQLACPGANNFLKNLPDTHLSQVTAHCAGGTALRIDGDNAAIPMRRFECAKWPEHQTIANGTCLWGKVRLLTGFAVAAGFVPLYESCFDPASASTIYVKFVLTSDAASAQRGVPRASWRGREHFPADPARLYQRSAQRDAIAALLGSAELADGFISQKSDLFLSKGHLAAKTDFLQGAAQTATLRYTNAAPQWQTFNGNNWNALENDVRAYVQKLGRDVLCYTGTYGRATLPDVHGVQRELFLGANGTVPVPRMYWKVVYDQRTQRAVAFVGLNNPHETRADAERDVRCRNVCAKLSGWKLTWRADDLHRGLSWCCEVNDFRANYADVLPAFAVVGLLN